MDAKELCEIVRQSVSAIDVGKALGLNVDRHYRCSCPFHNGTDRNLKLYEGNRGFYCFVCHKGGDCISLVTGVIPNCSYMDAMWWINDEFHLGLKRDTQKPTIRQRIRRQQYRKKASGE